MKNLMPTAVDDYWLNVQQVPTFEHLNKFLEKKTKNAWIYLR